MPGTMNLGALLGTNQSFDAPSSWTVPNSWLVITAQSSTYPATNSTDVHSSAVGLRFDVFSGAAARSLVYNAGTFGDFAAAFPEVATHQLALSAWAREAVNSGMCWVRIRHSGGAVTAAIAAAATLQRYNLSVAAIVGSGWPYIDFLANAFTTSAQVYADDMLFRVDEIALAPEWDFEERAQVLKAEHRTQGGLLHTYVWQKHFAYSVPLRFLADSHAALLNWWWERQLNLALTLDTSDGESTRIVRIVNDRQPVGRRMRPYADRWEGMIELESIDPGGLVF